MDQKSDEAADRFFEILPSERIYTPRHCRYCFMDFENDSDLEAHKKEMHPDGEQKYTCHKCNNDKLYTTYKKLRHHLYTHILRYKCKKCAYKSYNIHCIKSHIFKKHLKIAPFKCKFCGQCFYHPSNLNKHMLRSHMGRQIPPKKL